MPRKLLPEIMHNCRCKTYPDGTRRVMCSAAPVFRESGWELADKWEKAERAAPAESGSRASLARARRRAKTAVFDLAYSNQFRYFVTLTLDGSLVDRYDMSGIVQRLNRWLDNRVRRDGLAYVLVPELHKDGAVHFHGFFNGALGVVDSGTLSPPAGADGPRKPRKPRSRAQRAQWLSEGWHVVYNLPAWGYGFTTAIEFYGDRRAAAGYVCKYVTKQQHKIGGRWYYSGGNLARPVCTLFDADFEQLAAVDGAERWRLDGCGVDMISLEYRGDCM